MARTPRRTKALTKLAEAFLDAKPTPTALGDFNRQFANAVDKLAADIDSGDLRPSPASLVPPRWSTATESRAQ